MKVLIGLSPFSDVLNYWKFSERQDDLELAKTDPRILTSNSCYLDSSITNYVTEADIAGSSTNFIKDLNENLSLQLFKI